MMKDSARMLRILHLEAAAKYLESAQQAIDAAAKESPKWPGGMILTSAIDNATKLGQLAESHLHFIEAMKHFSVNDIEDAYLPQLRSVD